MKKAIQKITEIPHFKSNKPLKIICDTSKEGLGAVHQKKTEDDWLAIHFVSRFITTFEQKYSLVELEILAMVWSKEQFRNYVPGRSFEIVSDKQALTSKLKGSIFNRTISSRSFRVDRLLLFSI